jgi:hypothetical protein
MGYFATLPAYTLLKQNNVNKINELMRNPIIRNNRTERTNVVFIDAMGKTAESLVGLRSIIEKQYARNQTQYKLLECKSHATYFDEANSNVSKHTPKFENMPKEFKPKILKGDKSFKYYAKNNKFVCNLNNNDKNNVLTMTLEHDEEKTDENKSFLKKAVYCKEQYEKILEFSNIDIEYAENIHDKDKFNIKDIDPLKARTSYTRIKLSNTKAFEKFNHFKKALIEYWRNDTQGRNKKMAYKRKANDENDIIVFKKDGKYDDLIEWCIKNKNGYQKRN